MDRRHFILSGVALLAAVGAHAQRQSRLDRIGPGFDQLGDESRREIIRADYEDLIQEAMPHLNFIQAKLRRSGKGYALTAYHSLFTRYTFEAGPLANNVSAWLHRYQYRLQQAKIMRVGVHGTGEYGTGSSFVLK